MRALLLVSMLTLGACARPVTLPTAWTRADGQPVNSGLLDIDRLDCKDEAQKPAGATRGSADKGGNNQATLDDFVGCMRERGYVQIKG